METASAEPARRPGNGPNRGQPDLARQQLRRLMDPGHELRRDEIVWILSYVKQKAADGDPALLGLDQPRLLNNFARFAEAALLLINARNASVQEYDHIRQLLKEACHGLLDSGEAGTGR